MTNEQPERVRYEWRQVRIGGNTSLATTHAAALREQGWDVVEERILGGVHIRASRLVPPKKGAMASPITEACRG